MKVRSNETPATSFITSLFYCLRFGLKWHTTKKETKLYLVYLKWGEVFFQRIPIHFFHTNRYHFDCCITVTITVHYVIFRVWQPVYISIKTTGTTELASIHCNYKPKFLFNIFHPWPPLPPKPQPNQNHLRPVMTSLTLINVTGISHLQLGGRGPQKITCRSVTGLDHANCV